MPGTNNNQNNSAKRSRNALGESNVSTATNSPVSENSEQRKSKRARTQPTRLGTGEYEDNDDAMFERIIEEETQTNDGSSSTSSVATGDCSSIGDKDDSNANSDVNLMSPGEQLIFRKLIEIDASIKVLQRSIVEIRTDANYQIKVPTVNSPNATEIKELGLPLQNEKSFQEFDKKIQNMDLYAKAVCCGL